MFNNNRPWRKSSKIPFLIVVGIAVAVGPTMAQIATTWAGAAGDWSVATNWDNGVPGSVDAAFVDNNGAPTVALAPALAKFLFLGPASLTVDNQRLTDTLGFINAGGAVTIQGSNAKWINDTEIYIGNSGIGTSSVVVQNGAFAASINTFVGASASCVGALVVDGANSTLVNTTGLYVGNQGQGALTVQHGGIISNANTWIGGQSAGTVTVDGNVSRITNTENLYVGGSFNGGYGQGFLAVQNGGTVACLNTYVATSGGIIVDGQGSRLISTGTIYQGAAVGPTIVTRNGGKIEFADAYTDPGSTFTVQGSGTTVTCVGVFHHDGTMLVSDGGTVSSGAVLIGGDVTVSGNAVFETVGGLTTDTYGSSSTGTLTNAGTVRARGLVTLPGLSLVAPSLTVGAMLNSGLFNVINTSMPPSAPTQPMAGSYSQASSGTLSIEIDGPGMGQFGQVTVANTASLDGTLQVRLGSGYTPALGQVFPIVTCGSRQGLFTSFDGGVLTDTNGQSVAAASDRNFRVVYCAGSVAVVAMPAVIPATLQSSALLTSTYKATTKNLLVFDPASGAFVAGGNIDPAKPVVVLTHGFGDDPSMWGSTMNPTTSFAATLHDATPDVNIVAWDWSVEASGHDLGYAASRAASEGVALGQILATVLGPSYSNYVHFIGHSLGTLVNSAAVSTLHSHDFVARIQDTLLDEASVANQFVSPSGVPTYVVNPMPPTGSTVRVDNYVSSFGSLYPEAANTILQYDPNHPPDPTSAAYWDGFHSYPITWYQDTIGPTSSVGYGGAVEKGDLNLADPYFQTGTYWMQRTPGAPFALSASSVGEAAQALAARDDELLKIISDDSNGTFHTIYNGFAKYFAGISLSDLSGAIQVQNDAIVNLKVTQSGPVFVASPIIVLTKRMPTITTPSNVQAAQAPLSVTSDEFGHSAEPVPSSYAWLPLIIPSEARFLVMDFTFHDVSPGDFLAIGIGDVPLFQLESDFTPDGSTVTTGLLDVSTWSGENVQLFLGLVAADDANLGGTIMVENLTFVSVPEPTGAPLAAAVLAVIILVQRRPARAA